MLIRKKGQSVSGEFVVLVTLVAITIMAMVVYVRRTLQGRMRDATILTVARANAVLGQEVLIEYEPYYMNTTADTDAASTQIQRVPADNIISQRILTERSSRSQSVQLPFVAQGSP